MAVSKTETLCIYVTSTVTSLNLLCSSPNLLTHSVTHIGLVKFQNEHSELAAAFLLGVTCIFLVDGYLVCAMCMYDPECTVAPYLPAVVHGV